MVCESQNPTCNEAFPPFWQLPSQLEGLTVPIKNQSEACAHSNKNNEPLLHAGSLSLLLACQLLK